MLSLFLFVLMSLPSNAVETNSNSEFAKFFLRQTIQAQQYYSQFGNPFGQPVQYDQFGNPIPNQPQFNNGMNQGFQGQAPQGGPGGQNDSGNSQGQVPGNSSKNKSSNKTEQSAQALEQALQELGQMIHNLTKQLKQVEAKTSK